MLCHCHRTKQGKTGGYMQGGYKEIFDDDGYVNYLTQLNQVINISGTCIRDMQMIKSNFGNSNDTSICLLKIL